MIYLKLFIFIIINIKRIEMYIKKKKIRYQSKELIEKIEN